jgi:hypothetical protein
MDGEAVFEAAGLQGPNAAAEELVEAGGKVLVAEMVGIDTGLNARHKQFLRESFKADAEAVLKAVGLKLPDAAVEAALEAARDVVVAEAVDGKDVFNSKDKKFVKEFLKASAKAVLNAAEEDMYQDRLNAVFKNIHLV